MLFFALTNIYYLTLFPPILMQSESVDLQFSGLSTPFDPSGLQTLSALKQMKTGSFKVTLPSLLKSLPLKLRMSLCKLPVPGLALRIKTAISRFTTLKFKLLPENYHLLHQQDSHSRVREEINQSSFLCYLVFESDGEQFLRHLTLSETLLQNPQKMVNLLWSKTNSPEVFPMLEALSSRNSLETTMAELEKSGNIEEVEKILQSFLCMHILQNLHRYLTCRFQQGKHEDKRKTQGQLLSLWNTLSHQAKHKITHLNCHNIDQIMHLLVEKNISLTRQQLEHQLDQAGHLYSHIFSCSAADVFSPILEYRHSVYEHWKKETGQTRRKPIKAREERDYNSEHKSEHKGSQSLRHPKKRKEKSISLESNETNYTEHELQLLQQNEAIHKQEQGPQIKPQQYQRGQGSRREKRQAVYSTERQEKVKQRKARCKKDKNKAESKASIQPPEQKNSQIQHPHLLSSENKNPEIEGDTADSNFQKLVQKTNLLRLGDQLQEISFAISAEANQYHSRRINAFTMVQRVLQYYQIQIKLFGSCANGIAIKNSDIDIAIDQSILYRFQNHSQLQKLKAALELIQNILRPFPCFRDIRLIKTAAIPVVKLTIDTSLPLFQNEQIVDHNAGSVQADITVETISQDKKTAHVGIKTTGAIGEWLKQIKQLQVIVIVMKQLLAKTHLNQAYQGGLNTISMIVMFIAYIKEYNMQEEDNPAALLFNILTFYLKDFDQKQTGIDLLKTSAPTVFYNKEQYELDQPGLMKAQLEVRDPICQGKNMTRNCYQYPKIKGLFREVVSKCYQKSYCQLECVWRKRLQLKKEDKEIKVQDCGIVGKENVFMDFHEQLTN